MSDWYEFTYIGPIGRVRTLQPGPRFSYIVCLVSPLLAIPTICDRQPKTLSD